MDRRRPSPPTSRAARRRPRAWLEKSDRELVALARGVGALRLGLGDGLGQLQRIGAYLDLGFPTLGAYSLERLGRRARWAEDTERTARRLADLPLARHAVATGDLSWSMGDLLSRHATPLTEAALVDDAQRSTFRAMRAQLAEAKAEAEAGGEGAGAETAETPETTNPHPDEAEEPRRHSLCLTVETDVALAFEMTRTWVKARGGSASPDALVEALLAEAISTLQARHPALALPYELDDDERALADAWRDQVAQWRREAERECEQRIPGHGGEDNYEEGFVAKLSEAIEAAVAHTQPAEPPRDPHALDAHLRDLAHRLDRRDSALGELALEFWEADGWRHLGYASIGQYVRERLGLSRASLDARMTLARRVRRLPQVAAALDAGVIGTESGMLVARIAQPRTVQAWLTRATRRTVKHLREEVEAVESIARIEGQVGLGPEPPDEEVIAEYLEIQRAILDGRFARTIVNGTSGGRQMSTQMSGDAEVAQPRGDAEVLEPATEPSADDEPLRPGAGRVALRFWLGEDLIRLWQAVQAMFRKSAEPGPFEAFLIRSFWHTWLVEGPDNDVAYGQIYRRDLHRCSSPVCSRRDVTPHHLYFRGRGGGDEDDNITSLCVICHLDLVHGGRMEATPPADHIRWTLGRQPLIVVDGRQRVHVGDKSAA